MTYHVVSGRLTSADLKDGKVLTTVQGEKLYVSNYGGHIWINGAMIETKDVISSNGVTHVIDSVILPLSTLDANAVFKIKTQSKYGAKLAKLSEKQKEKLGKSLDMYAQKVANNTKLSVSAKASIQAKIDILKEMLWPDMSMDTMMDMMK